MSDLNPPSRSAALSSRGGRLARLVAGGGVVCGGGSLLRRHRYVHSLARSVQSADDGARPLSSYSTHCTTAGQSASARHKRLSKVGGVRVKTSLCWKKEGRKEVRREGGMKGRRGSLLCSLLARPLSLLYSVPSPIPFPCPCGRRTARGREGGQAEERASERASERSLLFLLSSLPAKAAHGRSSGEGGAQ